ncbi:hypothetical protein Tco_0321648 [Tanacetum coccineum]
MQAARDRLINNELRFDLKRLSRMEFEVGDKFVGPFIGNKKGWRRCSYQARASEEMCRVHNTFHFGAEPIEITDHEVKRFEAKPYPISQGSMELQERS